jgi:hypothetical protein
MLLGDDVVRPIRLLITDGDSDACNSLSCIIDDASTTRYDCFLFFLNSWLRHFSPTASNPPNKILDILLDTAKIWIKSWFWSITMKIQYVTSNHKIFSWLNSEEVTSAFWYVLDKLVGVSCKK